MEQSLHLPQAAAKRAALRGLLATTATPKLPA